ncbi:hypothetical protein GGI42DRAFT_201679 [Trichoderma sp. SZMC 28013]
MELDQSNLIIPTTAQQPPSSAFTHRTVLSQRETENRFHHEYWHCRAKFDPFLAYSAQQQGRWGGLSPHAPRHLFVALQLLLRMPPASPFTASPFDLVINPGQRANGPVRLGYTPPSGARDCDRKNKMESPDGALWKPLEGRPMPGAGPVALAVWHLCRLSPAIDAAPHGLNVCSCSLTGLAEANHGWENGNPAVWFLVVCGRLLISCTEYGVPAPARGTRYRSAAQVRVRSARRVFRALFLAF